MARLYVSTDYTELEQIIDPIWEHKHEYSEIEVEEAKRLAERVNFIPMSFVDLESSFSEKQIKGVMVELVKKGLFVTLEQDGKTITYKPTDLEERNKILSLALSDNFKERGGFLRYVDARFNLLLYSNNPNSIRELP